MRYHTQAGLQYTTSLHKMYFRTKIIMYSYFSHLGSSEGEFRSQVALPGNAGYTRKHCFKWNHFLQSTCSNWPFHISNSWLKFRRPTRKIEDLKHYLVPNRSHLKSFCLLCPCFVLGCWGQPQTLPPVLPSRPYHTNLPRLATALEFI